MWQPVRVVACVRKRDVGDLRRGAPLLSRRVGCRKTCLVADFL